MGDIGDKISSKIAEKFFANQGHGVLSLAKDNDSYGIPVSYGYDLESERCILQFVIEPESQKQQFLESSDTVTLTTYKYGSDDTWQSVVATGSLLSLSSDDVANWAAAIFFTHASNVETSARQEDSDTEVTWYELEIETLSGRTNTGDDSSGAASRLE
ncbi:pyridoxamine 5'-phosphate oxidase family protein [Natrinema pallidum]|uniref:Pyridoxamine 5'-phosphate oxidase-related FMN-binding protein n=1 Tax=Natrinema pallidum DSM 3751 TaxID=1227495 RepID=L9ZDR6_9EURY|nr:pyridoxamine 5'-phosphate oxidase family protein [Natrinema pallidum]ELY83742.1 pyridoxamine 5'-phosphate oxidase-related FMN- binding protein [Natrinema pallidum DSM 3751]